MIAGTMTPMDGSPTFMDLQRCQNFVNGMNFVLSEQGYNPKYVCWTPKNFSVPCECRAP